MNLDFWNFTLFFESTGVTADAATSDRFGANLDLEKIPPRNVQTISSRNRLDNSYLHCTRQYFTIFAILNDAYNTY